MESSSEFRQNRELFSNYYLDEYLPETEAWEDVESDEISAAYDDIQDLWIDSQGQVSDYNEAQLETNFIREILHILGITYEVQETTDKTQRRPDYAFFSSEEARKEAFERRKEGSDFYSTAIAVADAKRWGRALDTMGEHRRDFANPSYQIHYYLGETPVQWGVLTNGKHWRIYYGPTSGKLDSYYEINLPKLLRDGDIEDFKYFYLFFRVDAFITDSTGDCFLDDILDESNIFARELGEDLQENIYQAIKLLAEGYLEYSPNELSEDDLDIIHDSALIYLYRLIFVLYAESEGRELLPTDNRYYEQKYSLNTIKQEVAEELDSPDTVYEAWQTDLADTVDELFELIDQGSKSKGIPEDHLHIPPYNGGLFRMDADVSDGKELQFLADNEVGDSYLAEVIDLLARSQNGANGGKTFVDYSSLGVRHLGSIYEGLLEYHLNIADQPLGVENGEYVPADGHEVVVNEGEVYLTTDSGERKATGSYYTPEYVVDHIVENTLGPLVAEIREDLAGQSAREEGGFAKEFADRIFQLKILDPAMGSGHFLTNAVDYLAKEIIDAQQKQAEQLGIESIDTDRDIHWARRQVAQRCIYGVDVNPLAVELAKVSLWLRTLAAEQPLAFLDHHLKTGNSLVGSDIEAVLATQETKPEGEQLTLKQSFERTRRQALEQVTDQFEALLSIDNETIDDVKEMESVFEQAREDQLYENLVAMANVHTAEKFGLDVPEDAYERMAEALSDDSWADIEDQDWYRSAQILAIEHNFFHWELEFPIVFYEQEGVRRDKDGFDAVIGNPPYFSLSTIPEETKRYLSNSYPEIYAGNSDILYYFMAKAMGLLSKTGLFGMIVARYFQNSEYGDGIRSYIVNNGKVNTIVDFKNFQAFQSEADVLTNILIWEKVGPPTNYEINVLRISDEDADSEEVGSSLMNQDTNLFNKISVSSSNIESGKWELISKDVGYIKDKMESGSKPLGATYEIAQSMQTGKNEAFVVDKETVHEKDLEEVLIKKLAKTANVRRYLIKDLGKRLIWSQVDDITSYPNVESHLRQYKDDLEQRYDIQARDADWWKISNPRNEDLFSSDMDRILTPFMSTSNKFCVDSENHFNDGGDIRAIFPTDEENLSIWYTLSLLNSTAGEFYHKNTAKLKRDGYYEYFGNALEKFPIPQIDVKSDTGNTCQVVSSILQDSETQGSDILSNDDSVKHDILSGLSKEMVATKKEHLNLNLSLFDYLGIPSDKLPKSIEGKTLQELQMPISGVADTPLTETTERYDGLRIEGVSFNEDDNQLVMSVHISYKIDEDDSRETDRWGRLTESEFETYEAMAFPGLSDPMETLMREFVPVAINEAEGFADFRKRATKTNSPLSRLKNLTLPQLEEVQISLSQYMDVREEANELEEKMEKIDKIIDEIVYDLYDLTDEEIEIVETAVNSN